ncbi:hypothetical protein [Bartonella sp. HY038]|uniref:hypothetical protein n=1 Tax=Bartonella sp. HY038 TaxID=2759660 RepID=UPI001FEE7662|nr:hypothetical protein [Bartonella sp. HY038]
MAQQKAKTKAQHVKKRGGRPRIHGKLREPNGRVSRAKGPQEPIDKLAIEVRARRFGLNVHEARNPMAATFIGRLAMKGAANGLSQDQYDAALQFLKIRNDYRCSLLSPGAFYEKTGQSMNVDNMQEYTDWVLRARQRYQNAMKAIQEAQFDNGHENLYAALQYVIINDVELENLIGAARMVLNALVRHFCAKTNAPRRFS